MNNSIYTNRIRALEQALCHASLDLYMVPMVDEFQGEYIPEYAARLPYVTGFDGSAGLGMFWAQSSSSRRHTLFVDGRYTLQAARQVNADEILVLNSGDVTLTDWLIQVADAPIRVGFDGWLVTVAQLARWQKATLYAGIEWVAHSPNLVDSIWEEQPAPPAGTVMLQLLEHAGVSYPQKREAVLAAIAKSGANAVLLTQPDAINWLLNVRGSDVPFNPLLLSYLLLNADGAATLYMHPHALSDEVVAYLATNHVTIAPIANVFAGTWVLEHGTRLLVDPATTPVGIVSSTEKLGVVMIEGDDPTQLAKAIKNEVELTGVRDAHQRDGLALTRFLCWMQQRVEQKKFFDELEAIAVLESFRAKDANYRGPSFATIAGVGPNGAIIHYRADTASNRRARFGDMFLLDSGGQYPNGTTDVTRTVALGPATTVMKEHYTRVLKGHIALAAVQFPRGTSGSQLDVLARQYLWAAGLDFDHGTGHGVGAYLCVHEGPQRISKRGSVVPLVPGMILSNEPGYYLQGQYGIRIENLVVVVEASQGMLRFETLTLAPLDVGLVEVSMLTADERNWLNTYHRRVYDAYHAHMDYDERRWLTRATRAV